MTKFTFILIILSWLLIFNRVEAVNPEYQYDQISSLNKLSNGSVTCIFKDSSGMIWFGTWDGLNSYNGNKIKTYKTNPNDQETISDNIIKSIVEGDKGMLWIVTYRGINYFNTENGKVKRYFSEFEHSISIGISNNLHLSKAGENAIFCMTEGKNLYFFDNNKQEFTFLNIPEIQNYKFKQLKGGETNELWLLEQSGKVFLMNFEIDKNGIIKIKNVKQKFEDVIIKQFPFNGEQDILIIDESNKLYSISERRDSLDYILSIPIKFQNDIVREVIQVSNDYYISSMKEGVLKYSPNEGSTTIIKEMDNQDVLSMHYDTDQDIMWFGTNGNGAIKRYSKIFKFGSIFNEQLLSKSRQLPIRSINEDFQGNILVGSRGDGLKIISENLLDIRDVGSLSDKSILSLARSGNGSLFVGTEFDGIYILDKNYNNLGKLSLRSKSESNKIESLSAYCMYWDDIKNILWVGTMDEGLLKLKMDKINQGYHLIDLKIYTAGKNSNISSNTIFSILPQDSTSLWIATRGGGINIMDIENEIFTAYTNKGTLQISDNDVLCLCKSSDSILWAGTSYGLNRLNISNNTISSIRYYNESSGLMNNTIHGIVSDGGDNVWLSTNNGIMRFNSLKNEFTSYTSIDNLQSNEFSDGAYYMASNGQIYFGGVNGITYFHPSNIKGRSYIPPAKITSFSIQNQQINIVDRMAGEGPNIRIPLKYNENFFTIDFTTLEYINNENCEYSYMLEGFEQRWSMPSTSNTAVFTNVPPGDYTLKVRYTNGDKMWSDDELTMNITVGKPWWLSWWAYIIYFLIVVGLFVMIYQIIKRRIDFKRYVVMEQLEKKQRNEIHEAKLRFFTNIAHEFSTPLTLIYGPSQKLSEIVKDENARKYIRIIRSNAERMHHLILELMDFRKVETGHGQLRYEVLDVLETIQYITDNFAALIEDKKLNLVIETSTLNNETGCLWETDSSAFEKIIFNLISNALKYVNENGHIKILISPTKDILSISIINSGKGIKSEDLNLVFNRFQILDNFEQQASKGKINRTGIGLAMTKSLVEILGGNITVTSEVNNYVDFTVEIPRLSPKNVSVSATENLDTPESTPKVQVKVLHEKNNEENNSNTNRKSILVVDDEPEILDFVTDILQESYNVIVADSALKALEIINHSRPSLIISDIIMPEMDGLQLLEKLKESKFTNHIPVIFLSSRSDYEVQISGYKRGLETFISKPFNNSHLLAVVNGILDNRDNMKDYYLSLMPALEDYNGQIIHEEDKDFLVKVTEIIEDNIDNEALNAKFISSQMALSYIKFYQKLKELCNVQPSEFIVKIRLQYAANLLLTTNLSVQEIVFRCGFNNRSYFYRRFQKEYGVTPKEYIRTNS